jgi:hypothetical protein
MLAARLSEPRRTTLTDRLETDNRMEIDHERTAESMNLRSPESLGNSRAPLTINADDRDSYSRASELTPPRDTTNEEVEDNNEEGEIGWKKTKRGRRSGNKIQGYRRRDEECEARKHRRQGRR